jgi:hypothetical protein
MASSDRFRQILDLEIDPLTVSAAETQRIAGKFRQEGRERRRRQDGPQAEVPRVTVSVGWDRRKGRPIPG